MSQNQCCDEWSPTREVIDSSSGQRICTMCGRILESYMFEGSYGDLERCSDGLQSIQGGRGQSLLQRRIIASVAREESKTRTGTDFVDRFSSELRLAETVASWAREMLGDALDKITVRAESKIKVFAAGCLYFACKMEGVDRSENEIADGLGVTRHSLHKANQELRGLLAEKSYARTMLHGVNPKCLVPRMLQTVVQTALPDLTADEVRALRRRVEHMASNAEATYSKRGKKPQSVCAGLICLALSEKGVTPGTVSALCGISQGAVESAVDDLRAFVT